MKRQAVYRISLAMSDVWTGIIVFPSFIYSYCNSGSIIFNETYVNVIGFFTFLTLYVSVLTLLASAIDRFKVVYRPLTYKDNSNIAIGRKICVVVWLYSILVAISPTGIIHKSYSFMLLGDAIVLPVVLNDFSAFSILVLTGIIIPITILWIFTIMTFFVYKRHSKKRKKLFSTKRQKQKLMKEIKVFFTLGVMVGVFTICFLPAAALPMAIINTIEFNSTAVICIAVMAMSNSLWNFFIYSAREKEFRTKSKNLYKKLLFRLK